MHNYKKKTIAALLLCFLLMFTFISADTLSSKLTDIKGHWGEKYIKNVVDKGLMQVISGTKFKPDEELKNYDAIVSIAKMMGADKADLAKLEQKYKANVLDKYKVPEAARKYIAFAIEKAIISPYDAQAFQTKTLTVKKDVCLYLGRAFGVTKAKESSFKLAYKDAALISETYVPHIQMLISKGILDNPSIVSGNFNPGQVLTRATFAKILDSSNTAYSKSGTSTGTNTGSNSGTSTGTNDTENSSGADDSAPAGTTSVKGYFSDARPEYQNLDILTSASAASPKKTYGVSESITATLDGKSVKYWEYNDGDSLTLYMEKDKIIKIVGESKQKTYKGVYGGSESGDKTYANVIITDNITKRLIVRDTTVIEKDGLKAVLSDLKKGNTVEAVCEYDELVSITAKSEKSTAKGVIQSITYTINKLPMITIKEEGTGEARDFSISSNISSENVIIMGKLSDVYALRPGMNVNLDVESEEITRIITIEKVITSVSLTGTVKNISSNAASIILEVYDASQQKTVEKVVLIHKAIMTLSTDPKKVITIADIKLGDIAIIVGKDDFAGITADTLMLVK